MALLLASAALAADRDLKHDNGKLLGKKSHAGTGHVISFLAPRGKWWVKSVMIHGARYGGRYDPAQTPFSVTVCDSRLKPLTATDAMYDRFKPGRFEWVEIAMRPALVPRKFSIVVEFRPTATKGVFVGYSEAKRSHSGYGVPGGRLRPFEPKKEWMIRVRLAPRGVHADVPQKEKPGDSAIYVKDFEFVARTVRLRFPALKKKGLDWKKVCDEWRPRFKECTDDKTHILNMRKLLALLNDAHTSIFTSRTSIRVPAFDGLYGGGLWIAAERNRLILRAALRDDLTPGSELLTVNGRPAREVHADLRKRLHEWYGWSSEHFLDARLSFQFFPFGQAKRLPCEFLDPSGEVKRVELERWGPGGKGLSRLRATLPEGIEFRPLALSKRLDGDLGYVRITGAMDGGTQRAFDIAMEAVKGVRGLVLDCRGMGGGGDGPAWAMAGRFFKKRKFHVKPSGEWQFEGRVVMLTDEREISSAETFTWAMHETGRVVNVGRPTGGATIIPQRFDAPSGLFSFRMGTHDRRTPIKRVQPEGIGTAPDIYVPYEPYLLEHYGDPVFGVGLGVLKALVAGKKRHKVVERFGAHYGCDPKPLLTSMIEWEIRRGPDKGRLEKLAGLAGSAGLDELAARARKQLGR